MAARLPVWYIPHGGGPCFFMDPPAGAPNAWKGMEAYLRGNTSSVEGRPMGAAGMLMLLRSGG